MFNSLHEFVKHMTEAFPNATWGEDNDGQLIIYTGLHFSEDSSIVSLED